MELEGGSRWIWRGWRFVGGFYVGRDKRVCFGEGINKGERVWSGDRWAEIHIVSTKRRVY